MVEVPKPAPKTQRAAWADDDARRLVYEHIKDAPDLFIADGGDLDRKGIAILSAASIVVAAAGLGKISTSATGFAAGTSVYLLVAAAAYVWVLGWALVLLWPVTWIRTKQADNVVEPAKERTAAEYMDQVISSAEVGYKHNREAVASKSLQVRMMAAGLGVEVLAIFAALARLWA
jgi:hypothetical protein